VEYHWSPEVRPGVKGNVSIDVAGLGGEWTVATWWGPKLEGDTLILGAHAGTPTSATFTPGTKSFTQGARVGDGCAVPVAPRLPK
jgi:hypothetical protein